MKLIPDDYTVKFTDYDFASAYSAGKRLILFDLDNTLVPHGAMADEGVFAIVGKLREMGFDLGAVSNNDQERVRGFCDPLDIPYSHLAHKPDPKGYIRLMELFGRTPGETLFFGDQIFTDIWGANRAGIRSVLVKPVDKSTDEIQIVIKRIAERILLGKFFREKGIRAGDHFG